MASGKFLFTSESVSMGHPDKLAAQISDGVLDALLAQDPMSRVACETLVTTDYCVLAGEITTKAKVNYEKVARETIAAEPSRWRLSAKPLSALYRAAKVSPPRLRSVPPSVSSCSSRAPTSPTFPSFAPPSDRARSVPVRRSPYLSTRTGRRRFRCRRQSMQTAQTFCWRVRASASVWLRGPSG